MRQCMDSTNLHRRIKKIIGQLNAIDKMVDEDVPCEDVLIQINAAKSALHKVGQVVLEGHLNHCVREGIEHGDADKTISSLIQTAMSDGDGYSYSIALSDDEKASLNGNVAAGKKLRGEVTFELPKEAKELEFTFKGALEKGSITWKL